MSDVNVMLPWSWVERPRARRPKLPSQMRTSGTRVTEKLPWARADHRSPRPLLPWEHRTGNDWRGVTP